ncbi:MAG: hypothetical protein KJN75_02890, partial [Muriicola sp.]|nr:hypothetical protein [Muriicola sp.]
MRWLLIALGFIAILFFSLWVNKLGDEKENPQHEKIIEELKKRPLEKEVILVTFPSNDSLTFTVLTQPCTSNTKASVTITTTNGLEGYTYEITQPDGTNLGPQTQNSFFDLSQIGNYTITITDAMGISVSETFTIKEDCNPKPPLPHTDPVDGLSYEDVITKPTSPVAGAVDIDSIYTDIDDIINDLKEIKADDIKNWRFNKSEVHLVGIGIKQNPTQFSKVKKILLLLLVDDKVFKFDASMPSVNEEFFRLKQIKYSLKIPFFGDKTKYRLRLEGRYYTDFNGRRIPYKEADSLERYKVFGEIIKEYRNEDNIYYSFLDQTDFKKTATEKKYNRIYGIMQ